MSVLCEGNEVESLGWNRDFYPMSSGGGWRRFCQEERVVDDRGRRTARCWKASSGCCARERGGATCHSDTQTPALAGGGSSNGRSKASGWICGEASWNNSAKPANWTGVKPSSTRASRRQKGGPRRRQNQEGQRHEVDGGGRRRGCSSGKLPHQRVPRGSHPCRTGNRALAFAPPPVAANCRSRLRQRSAAPPPSRGAHRVDLPASTRTHAPAHPGGQTAASLPQALEDRADLCLAR